MKKIILCYILLFCCFQNLMLPLAAQEVPYTPFPKGNIAWQSFGSEHWFACPTFSYVLSIDSALETIEGKIYNKVFYDRNTEYEQYVCGIREEDKKIYLYVPNLGEHLIYDFGLEIGDTLFYSIRVSMGAGCDGKLGVGFFECYELYPPYYQVIYNKGITTLENGESRNTLFVEKYLITEYGHEFDGTNEWIEGLGTITYYGSAFFGPIYVFFGIHDRNFFDLACVCQDNKRLFSASPECSLCNGNSINKKIQQKITLHPNPTTGELTIELGQAQLPNEELTIMGVEIFDIYGRKQKAEWRKQNEEIVIDILHLPAGVYFVKIETRQGIFTEKIIKE